MILSMLEDINVAKSDIDYIDITQIHSTKGKALKKVAAYFNIALENTLCIGDNENDLDMMEVAGLSIAMGNAEERIKKKADVVSDDNENDGVAKALYQYVIK